MNFRSIQYKNVLVLTDSTEISLKNTESQTVVSVWKSTKIFIVMSAARQLKVAPIIETLYSVSWCQGDHVGCSCHINSIKAPDETNPVTSVQPSRENFFQCNFVVVLTHRSRFNKRDDIFWRIPHRYVITELLTFM